MAELGALVVKISGDASDLIRELDRGGKKLDTTARAFGAAGTMAKVFAGAAAAAATTLALVIHSAAESADKMGKLAEGAGLATKTFSELSYVARLNNIDAGALSATIGRLNRNVLDTAAGQGEAMRAFTALGISVRDNNGQMKSADTIINEVADKFATMEDGASKATLAMLLFGRAGVAMIPMLNQGSAGISALRKEAEDLGVAVDSKIAKQANEFNDNLTRIGQVAQGAANNLLAELLPSMIQVADQLVSSGREAKGFKDEMAELADFIRTAVVTTFQTIVVTGSDVAFVFKMVGGELGRIAAQATALAHGDWEGFKLIGDEWDKDSKKAREDLDAFQARIMQISDKKPTKAVGDKDFPAAKKQAAPQIDKADNGDFVAKQMQEGADEEARIQAEAVAATVMYRDKQLQKEKAFIDARNKVLMDAFDAEQEREIEQAAILLEEDGQSHTAKLQSLQEYLDGGMAAEQAAYEQRLKDLELFSDAELEALGGRNAIKEQMERDHLDRMRGITAKGHDSVQKMVDLYRKGDVQGALQTFTSITAGLAAHNRKFFELNKAAGIANAIINAYEGISLTLKSYPFPLSAVMAAAQAGLAFAQVKAISSQSFGSSGGAAPSLAGSTPAAPVTPVGGGAAGGGNDQTLFVSGINPGDLFTGDVVHSLMDKIIEAQRNGANIVLRR